MCLNIEVGKQKQRIINKNTLKKKYMIFFFFFEVHWKSCRRWPELGGWGLEMAGGGCWTQTIGLETCIESLIG
jgi:hypothetical protein